MVNTMSEIHPVSRWIDEITDKVSRHQKLRKTDEANLTEIMRGISQDKIYFIDATNFVKDGLSRFTGNWHYGFNLSIEDLSEMSENLAIGSQLKQLTQECDLTKGYLVVISVMDSVLPPHLHRRLGTRTHGLFQTAMYIPFSRRSKKVLPKTLSIVDQKDEDSMLNHELWNEGFASTPVSYHEPRAIAIA